MAERVVEEVRILKRGGGVAATLAFFALLVACVALYVALHASRQSHDAKQSASNSVIRANKLEERINTSLGQSSAASDGAGAGSNSQQAVPGINTNPNGNGQ